MTEQCIYYHPFKTANELLSILKWRKFLRVISTTIIFQQEDPHGISVLTELAQYNVTELFTAVVLT